MQLRISDAELGRRRRIVLAEMETNKLNGYVFWNSTSIFYLSGFKFLPTERPLGAFLTSDDHFVAFVPRLELEHATETGRFDRVISYPEYPGPRHPMLQLGDALREAGLGTGTLGADADGYPGRAGYMGPRLSEVMDGARVSLDHARLVESLRVCKTADEIELIRESTRWGNLAHALLQSYTRAGLTETEIASRASLEATAAMVRTLGPGFESRTGGENSAIALFRGQIGPNSALPHAINKNIRLQRGDVLVTGAVSWVFGYGSELERTMFVGEPSAEQARFFRHAYELQEVAFRTIRPGRPCADVDREVRRYYEENDLMPYWRHHVGHNLGLEGHERPFLDIGDESILQPGMVFSIEPGLYVPGLGGFRHSDTIVVTEGGMEMVTYYPRDLESMICGV